MLRRLLRCEIWDATLLLGVGPVTVLCDAEPDTDGRRTLGIRLILGR